MLNPLLSTLFYPVSKVPGGPKTTEAFKRLKIFSVRDLILHAPIAIIDRRKMQPISSLMVDEITTQVIEVISVDLPTHRSRPAKILAKNNSGFIEIVYFNIKPGVIDKFKAGEKLAISGKVAAIASNRAQIHHPEYVTTADKLSEIQVVEAIYPSTYGTTSKYISNAVERALKMLPKLPEWLPEELVKSKNWPSWNDAINKLHNPSNILELAISAPHRERLAADEIFAQQVSLFNFRTQALKIPKPPLTFDGKIKAAILDNLPFQLTSDQLLAVKEIEEDQRSNHKMMRLIQGDVGCGKTLIALIAMCNTVEAGKKALIMAPTELLASQHFSKIKEHLGAYPIKVELLISNMKVSARRKVLAELMTEEPLIVVGTHALIQDKVNYKNLGLVVVDEQHRFGVNQREKLININSNADFLMMTATPIPRTLAMTNNGDLDISWVRSKPAIRKEIKTAIAPVAKLKEIIEGLINAIANGEKAYWVCPLIEESEVLDVAHVEDRFASLQEIFGDKVAMIHGRVAVEERDEIMAKFKSGQVKVLVATSVIEVGVDVADATIMIIENCERFGLAQLHQIRGRVGRGDLPSSCLLIYGRKISKIGMERLKALRSSNDGFYLAEQDLRIRGSGDILGTKQSGLPDFKFFDIFAHESLLIAANKYVRSLEKSSKQLELLTQLFMSGGG